MRSCWRRLVALALFVLFSCPPLNPAHASPGDLDRVFGTEIMVSTNFYDGGGLIDAVAILPDGRVLAAGSAASSNQGFNVDFALVRYNTDGSLDTSFGTGGKQITDFNGFEDAAAAMALQPDGKIILVGTSRNAGGQDNSNFALARYNANGSLDSTFGAGGKVNTDISGHYDNAVAMALQSDGKIIAAGATVSTRTSAALVRYNPDGSLDLSFGIGGKMVTDSADTINAIALQPGGKIVAAGYRISTTPTINYDFAVFRLNSDGALDSTFGSAGKTVTDFFGMNDFARSCALGPDGKIIVAGRATRNAPSPDGDYEFGLARYDENGIPDASFGNGGRVITDFSSIRDEATHITLQPDGKIVAVGQYLDSIPSFRLGLARYNSNGSLDSTFGDNGRVATSFPSGSSTITAALQADSKIIVGGAGGFTLQRYNADGGRDPGFHSRGTTTTTFSNRDSAAYAVAVQVDGKIIAAGTTLDQNRDQIFALARYNLDGSLDASFGSGGTVTDDFGAVAFALLIQPDGQIVAGGTTPSDRFGLIRLNPDGSPDRTFGNRGRVETEMLGHDRIRGLALQLDGKIVAAGEGRSSFADSRFVIARYKDDGSLDSGFGVGGKVIPPRVDNIIDLANAVGLQADGKIVVAGSTQDMASINRNKTFVAARYNGNGAVDTSFGTGGRVTNAIRGIGCEARAIAIQGDGKILLGGYDRSAMQAEDFALLRYDRNGVLDAGFGAGGAILSDFFGRDDDINGLALAAGGRIVAAGQSDNKTRDFALAVFKEDGRLDPGFGLDGKVTTSLGSSETGHAVALGQDGGIVVAGGSLSISHPDEFVIARYEGFGGGSAGPTYDLCLQDETNGDLLKVNSQTGEYQFVRCGAQGLMLAGRAKLKVKKSGCLIKLTNLSSDREVTASISTCKKNGSASVRILSTGQTFPISDRDLSNNQCACP